ncbi:MAG: hypothetical protein IPK73_28980 [Candidatus Obscuribacter sp.]|nr:hypothetical protein [Candidatus Obscuribacter sp.]
MCLSNNRYPQTAIKFTDTILLGLEVEVDGKVEHVIGYYNKVAGKNGAAADGLLSSSPAVAVDDEAPQLLSGKPVRRGSRPMSLTAPRTRRGNSGGDDFDWNTPDQPGKPATIAVGNAMLIAVPATPGTVTGKSLIPVSDYPNFMQDYARAVGPRTLSRGGLRRGGLLGGAKSVEVVKGFDKGTYDVVIAGSAKAIAGAIEQVDAAKRPIINEELYAKLDKLYPKWTFVLFCFAEESAAKAGCAMLRYQPMDKFAHFLYLPGLDGHNGDVETGDVELNHTLVVGSCKMSASAAARDVDFRDAKFKTDLPFMVSRVIGKIIPAGTKVPQGDFLFKLDELRAGTFRARRVLPPGWTKVYGKSDAKPFYIEG